jgi:hypothetical protein
LTGGFCTRVEKQISFLGLLLVSAHKVTITTLSRKEVTRHVSSGTDEIWSYLGWLYQVEPENLTVLSGWRHKTKPNGSPFNLRRKKPNGTSTQKQNAAAARRT